MNKDALRPLIYDELMLLTLRFPNTEVLLLELPICNVVVFSFVPMNKDALSELINWELILLVLSIPKTDVLLYALPICIVVDVSPILRIEPLISVGYESFPATNPVAVAAIVSEVEESIDVVFNPNASKLFVPIQALFELNSVVPALSDV